MKTNKAIKEIKVLGIVMSLLGVVLIFIGISSLPRLSDWIISFNLRINTHI